MKWVVAAGCDGSDSASGRGLSGDERAELDAICSSWNGLESRFEVETLKENRLRTVARVSGRSRRWIIKRYRALHWLQRLRSRILGAHAEREFRALRRLGDWGDGWGAVVPEAFAFGERREGGLPVEGGLIMAEVPGASPLGERVTRNRLMEVGRVVRQLHDRGVHHPDLHGANFLLSHGALFLIDFHSCRFPGRVSRAARTRALAKVYHSFASSVSAFDVKWFLAAYLAVGAEGERLAAAAANGDPLTEAILAAGTWRTLVTLERTLRQRSERMERRRLRSRSGRCLVDSTSFAVGRSGRFHVRRARSFPLELALGLAGPVPRGEVVKARGESWVAYVPPAPPATRAVYLKYRRYSSLERLLGFFRRHRLLDAWIVGHGMRVRGLPAPPGLALIERRRFGLVEAAWLVQEAVPGASLDVTLRRELDGANDRVSWRQDLSRALGELARRLHGAGLRAHDFSPQNVVVADGGTAIEFEKGESDELAHHRRALEGARLWFVDLDHVRFVDDVPDHQRLRNLVQLGNLPEGHVTTSDRARALRAYDRGDGRYFNRVVVNELREGLLDEALHTLDRMTRAERTRNRVCEA